MFTGIIEKTGIIKKIKPHHLIIGVKNFLTDLKVGDSMAVNGVCLTIIKLNKDNFEAELMPETLRLTNFLYLRQGDAVNLEKSLKIGERLSGHFVLGHIDGVCVVSKVYKVKSDFVIEFKAPQKLMRYIVRKGSVTLDGVSLTVVAADKKIGKFMVALIPYTIKNTTLGHKKVGDKVNVEVDMLARYVNN